MKELYFKFKGRNYIHAFFIPVACMMIFMLVAGIYPFGTKTFMTIDLTGQYVPFYSYLKEIIHNPSAVFYSFSKTLGGGMIGLTAYYLMSPLNLIYLFVSTEQLPNAVAVVSIIKMGLLGLSFYVYTGKTTAKYLVVSTAYALMSFSIVYMSNLMWLDDIILLPLVMLGIEKIVARKKPWLYLGTLFAALMLNYYIGYMICIFSMIYFCYQFFFVDENNRNRIRVIFNYALASLLAGGLSAVLLIPVKYSLEGEKAGINLSMSNLHSNFTLQTFFSKYIIGSFSYDEIVSGSPNIYCGISILAFLFLFFTAKSYSLKNKIGAFGVLLILYLSFNIDALNLIWHGFNYPIWFPYRNSFLFCFFLLVLAGKGMESYNKDSMKRLYVIVTISVLIYTAVVFWVSRVGYEYLSKEKILISVGTLALAAIFILISYKRQQIGMACLLLLVIGELCLNGCYNMKALSYADLDVFQSFVREVEPAVKEVAEQDSSFYRMEKTFTLKGNDPLLLDFKGLSHYSSTEKMEVRNLMGALGFRNNGNWSSYNTGTTYANDSFLGVKYLLTEGTLGSGYEYIDSIGDVNIYENNYALSLGYMVDEATLPDVLAGLSWFDGQNQLWKSLVGKEAGDIFQQQSNIQTVEENVTVQQNEDESIVYQKNGKKPYIEYHFIADSSDPMFAYFTTDEMHEVKIDVNGDSIRNYFTPYDYQIVRLGQFDQGEEVSVKIYLKEDNVKINSYCIFRQDMNVFQSYYDQIKSQELTVNSYTNSSLNATVKSDGTKEYCLLTIPYDFGWHIYVDGERVAPYRALGTLMAFKVPEGEHTIEISYIPIGLKYGLVISFLSAVCIGIWVVISHLYKKSRTTVK